MPPKSLMQRIPDQIAVQLVEDAEDSPFFALFETLPDSISADDQERLRARATESTIQSSLPTANSIAISRNLPARQRDSVGLSALPNGSAWYELRARSIQRPE